MRIKVTITDARGNALALAAGGMREAFGYCLTSFEKWLEHEGMNEIAENLEKNDKHRIEIEVERL